MKKMLLGLILLGLVGMPAYADDSGGDIHYDQPVVGVLFSHASHVEEAGLDCDSCHDDLFSMEARAVQQEPDFNMLALSEGRYCGACHDGEMAFSSSTRCASCHEGAIGFRRALGLEATGVRH